MKFVLLGILVVGISFAVFRVSSMEWCVFMYFSQNHYVRNLFRRRHHNCILFAVERHQILEK